MQNRSGKIAFCIMAGFCVFLSTGCQKEERGTLDAGYNYFPTEIGKWVVYDVDSMVYDVPSGIQDTFRFQIREVIESEYMDDEDRLTQRIERYKRDNDTLPWVLSDVWSSTRTAVRAERVEENRRFIKMIFAINPTLTWDGNAFNDLERWDYVYENLYKSQTVGNIFFDSTVTIVQRDNINLVETERASEVYAKHVGMIYKEFVLLETEITGEIVSGVAYELTIDSFGQE